MIHLIHLAVVFGCFGALYAELSPAPAPSSSETWDKVKIGYWPSYAQKSFPVSALNLDLYTHLFFAFAGMNSTTFKVEIPDDTITSASSFSALVKERNPRLKTLLSIGGATANSTHFSLMASSFDARQSFIQSSIELAQRYSFDGLDLDWEFPSSEADMKNLGVLLEELRAAVDSKPLLLTAAVYYSALVPDMNVLGLRHRYPVEILTSSLDLVNIMCYDYHGSWEKTVTGEHAALYDPISNLSSSYGIGTWLQEGLPPEKAVMGLALYGHSWLLANESSTGVGAAARGPGPAQNSSATAGIFFYFEIEEFVRSGNASVVVDSETGSAYCYAGQVWVGFDNDVTIEKKVSYLLEKGMRGYFFWTASFDSNSLLSITASRTLDTGTPVSAPPPSPGGDGQGSSSAKHEYMWRLSVLVIFTLFLI